MSGRCIPDLQIVGHSHGYLKGDALRAKVDEINALAPDYLWVALGVPYEQAFVEEFTPRLSNVGVIKTSGGLFNFLSGSRARAPQWMQIVGLEWAWRIWLEPRRLFWRYLTTNPRALYLLFNKSRPSAPTGRREADMNDRPAILVTGGAGYIGSHCCRALAAAGYHPVVYDNFSTGHRSFVTGSLVTGDLADKAALAHAFAQHDIVAVMHFAASSLVGESVADPQKYYINNVAGTLSLLEAMREAGCHRLVFSSTGAVYGNADSKALPESYPCAPINPYGASKWMIERMLADYRSAYGLGSFCLRYFNASGADASGGIGELRDNETHLIPRAMMALQGHVADFAVFGDDYDTPDGTAIRDYIHVTDLAAAHVLALKLLMQGHSRRRLQSRHRHRLFGARDPRRHRGRDRPRGAACRSSRGDRAIRPIWSPTPPRRARSLKFRPHIPISRPSSGPPGPGTRRLTR